MTATAAKLDDLRQSVRDVLGQFQCVPGARDTSADARARMWSGMVDQLGLGGLGIAEKYGGGSRSRNTQTSDP